MNSYSAHDSSRFRFRRGCTLSLRSATDEPAELTPGVIILGVVLGLLFAASSVYLALKVSLTVSASIPVAVLSITIFRYISRVLGRPPATILQNNMVQTTGSAGESIASGISFTLPALLLLGYNLPWSTVTAIGVVGGILGVVFMIPLRRSLIVKEHANLKYPEGTACAQVLIVGEQRGVQAKTVFMGFGLGALYKFLTSGLAPLARSSRSTRSSASSPAAARNSSVRSRPRSARSSRASATSSGRASPAICSAAACSRGSRSFRRSSSSARDSRRAIFPANKLIADMSASEIRSNYIYYIGAGAVTAAGPHQPRAARCRRSGRRSSPACATSAAAEQRPTTTRRTERDMPMIVVVVGALALRDWRWWCCRRSTSTSSARSSRCSSRFCS